MSSELVVYTYEHPDKASEVLAHIAELKRDIIQKPLIGVEDAAVAVKGPEGTIRIRQTLEGSLKASSLATGGLWGVLVGFLFGGPLLGGLVGAGISWLLGRSIDVGINNDFITKVSEQLQPGRSALLLLVKDTPIDVLSSTLNAQGGRLFHTTFSPEAAEAFTQAAASPEVQALTSATADR
jgi:uncharacterized membrane protein